MTSVLDDTDELADLLEARRRRAGAVGRYKVIVSTIAQFRKSLSSDKSSDVRSIGSGSQF
ncbi:hypothetical protein E4U09_000661 [Claviceps aff. purpurea]|uniref:Uncharacterized protein n=1 Tax=Claviceps aff. purpurea TaxID=1967640 RepID=A0A9P7QAP9_9HYPO|nr:hypothetical protein E4U09_000661 [Claviceps aff. purpurea]